MHLRTSSMPLQPTRAKKQDRHKTTITICCCSSGLRSERFPLMIHFVVVQQYAYLTGVYLVPGTHNVRSINRNRLGTAVQKWSRNSGRWCQEKMLPLFRACRYSLDSGMLPLFVISGIDTAIPDNNSTKRIMNNSSAAAVQPVRYCCMVIAHT